jgi:hypothetical protein
MRLCTTRSSVQVAPADATRVQQRQEGGGGGTGDDAAQAAALHRFVLYESATHVALVPEGGADHAPALLVRRVGDGRVVVCGKKRAQAGECKPCENTLFGNFTVFTHDNNTCARPPPPLPPQPTRSHTQTSPPPLASSARLLGRNTNNSCQKQKLSDPASAGASGRGSCSVARERRVCSRETISS